MYEAPKKRIRQWLPIGMIVVSVIGLFFVTDAQARRQREAMEYRIWLSASQLNYVPNHKTISEHLRYEICYFFYWFTDYDSQRSDYRMAIILSSDDLEQPIEISATQKTPPWLIEKVYEGVREHVKLDCQHVCVHQDFRYGVGFNTLEGNTFEVNRNPYKMVRHMNFCVEAGEEGRLFVAWVVECNPFQTAMLQLIPVYLLTALLLTALFLTRKKYMRSTTCPTPPNPT